MKPVNKTLKKEVESALAKVQLGAVKHIERARYREFVLASFLAMRNQEKNNDKLLALVDEKIDKNKLVQTILGDESYNYDSIRKELDEKIKTLLDMFGPDIESARAYFKERRFVLDCLDSYDLVANYYKKKFA